MIACEIPGMGPLRLRHLVLDYNGTLAVDGGLLPGVAERLQSLAKDLSITVLTADTFGRAAQGLGDLPCELAILPEGSQDIAKREFVRGLGAEMCVCIGNGRNDRLMLETAALGVAVILGEGAAGSALLAADVVCTSITSALDLLVNPLRLAATLRC
ncbi:MAG: ATPase P [Desulfosarcinaceae bacterium]|nr:ATPase P [Desulfosarcinaceae bacterium]